MNKTYWKIILLSLIIIACLNPAISIYARERRKPPVQRCVRSYLVNSCYDWDVVVAVDEEMMESIFVMYKPYLPGGFDLLSAPQYACGQVLRGFHQYKVQFDLSYRVVKWCEWESSDHLHTADELLSDMVQKIWMDDAEGKRYKSGSYLGDYPCSKKQLVLIGFTKQAVSDSTAGICWIADGDGVTVNAILISYTTTWVDDNIIMHELGHLHGLSDHPASEGCLNCIMEYNYEDVWFYNEPLQPLYDSHAQLDLLLWTGCIRGGYIHYTFCEECKNIVEMNPYPGNHFPGEHGEIIRWDSDEGIVEELPKPDQPKPQITIGIVLVWIGIFIMWIQIVIWLFRKKEE